MADSNSILLEYTTLKEKIQSLTTAYNKLLEKTNCPCGASILCDGHKEGCVRPRVVKKAAYKKVAVLLFELLMLDRQLHRVIGKL